MSSHGGRKSIHRRLPPESIVVPTCREIGPSPYRTPLPTARSPPPGEMPAPTTSAAPRILHPGSSYHEFGLPPLTPHPMSAGPCDHSSKGVSHDSQTAPHRRSSGAWTKQSDQILLQARAQGLNWKEIQAQYFPGKTSNACRKRHERLMECKGADDMDARWLELLATEYMAMRKEIWQELARRTGQRWKVVEAKCLSYGLKNLQSSARAAIRREKARSTLRNNGPEVISGARLAHDAEAVSEPDDSPSEDTGRSLDYLNDVDEDEDEDEDEDDDDFAGVLGRFSSSPRVRAVDNARPSGVTAMTSSQRKQPSKRLRNSDSSESSLTLASRSRAAPRRTALGRPAPSLNVELPLPPPLQSRPRSSHNSLILPPLQPQAMPAAAGAPCAPNARPLHPPLNPIPHPPEFYASRLSHDYHAHQEHRGSYGHRDFYERDPHGYPDSYDSRHHHFNPPVPEAHSRAAELPSPLVQEDRSYLAGHRGEVRLPAPVPSTGETTRRSREKTASPRRRALDGMNIKHILHTPLSSP